MNQELLLTVLMARIRSSATTAKVKARFNRQARVSTLTVLHGKDEATGITISDERGRRRIGLGNRQKLKTASNTAHCERFNGQCEHPARNGCERQSDASIPGNGPNRLVGLGLVDGTAALVIMGADKAVRETIGYTDDERIKIDAHSKVSPAINITDQFTIKRLASHRRNVDTRL